VALIISGHTQALLYDNLGGVVLQVEPGLCILDHRSHAYMEVWALSIEYDLKALLPHGVSLIAKREERDWQHSGVSKATPTQ
jgi:hypothetical protein